MLRRAGLLVLVGVLLAPGTPAWGQVRQQRRQQGRPQLEERVQVRFGEIVRRELGLTMEEQQALGDVVQSFAQRRLELGQRQAELQRRLALPLTLEDRTGAQDLLNRMVEVREMELQLLRDEHSALLEIMSVERVARFFQRREELGARVRQLRGGIGFGAGGPPGGIGRGGGVGPDTVGVERGDGAPWR